MPSSTKSRSGFTLLRIAVIVSITALTGWGALHYHREKEVLEDVERNLRQVYSALEHYEMAMGRLPQLAFFPDDPIHDPDSLIVALSRYGVTPEILTCPNAPESIRQIGLNYVWNVQMNKKKLLEPGARRWLLVNIHALSSQVPPPHLGKYSVLYSDGSVEFQSTPPEDILQR